MALARGEGDGLRRRRHDLGEAPPGFGDAAGRDRPDVGAAMTVATRGSRRVGELGLQRVERVVECVVGVEERAGPDLGGERVPLARSEEEVEAAEEGGGGRGDAVPQGDGRLGSGLDAAQRLGHDSVEAAAGDAGAEEGRGDVLEAVRLVDDDPLVVGQHGSGVIAANHEIGQKEVVVDDEQLRRLRFALEGGHEAALVEGTARPEAGLARRGREPPDGVVFFELVELGQIAAPGLRRPALHERQRSPHRLGGLRRGQGLETAAAEVVAEALHQERRDLGADHALGDGEIFEEDLLLERLARGGHDHAPAAGEGGHEISEGLARAGAGLADEHAIFVERPLHRLGHLELATAMLVAIEGARQRALGAE